MVWKVTPVVLILSWRILPRDQGLWNCRGIPRLSQTPAYVGHSSHAYLVFHNQKSYQPKSSLVDGYQTGACQTFHRTVAPCPGYAPWTSRMLLNISKYLLGRLLGRGSFARAPLSVILFDQIGPSINSRRKIYGSTSLHFAQLMRLQQEDLTKTHIDQCNQDARIQPNINAFIDLPGVFMLYTPSTSFLVLAKAFFRGSSEQYGFLIKVTPPSIMGGERNLSQ
ncbi:hypothetical protein VNO77_34619 [Canavalia gladiata]|uniref:Uncharacterized protein n=1 Tax=Canavalia gladiata TaxID=3824 RepID=A0AAN9PZZ2_CANGL